MLGCNIRWDQEGFGQASDTNMYLDREIQGVN